MEYKLTIVIVLCRVARVVAPKKAALKEAEAELSVAMEVTLFSYVAFNVSLLYKGELDGRNWSQKYQMVGELALELSAV